MMVLESREHGGWRGGGGGLISSRIVKADQIALSGIHRLINFHDQLKLKTKKLKCEIKNSDFYFFTSHLAYRHSVGYFLSA